MKYFFTIAFLAICNIVAAQSVDTPTVKYEYVEQMPEPRYNLYKFLGDSIRYPPVARDSGIEAKVYAKFVVREDGHLENFRIVRRVRLYYDSTTKIYTSIDVDVLGYGFEEEVLRVLHLLPKWRPGKQNGKPVSVYYTLPLQFKLQ